MSLTIHALHVGTLRKFPTAAISFQRGYGEFHDVPMIMFAITGGEFPIIVDTGTGTPEYTHQHHGYTLTRTPEQEPAAALKRIGVNPDDVQVIINTHLHWDHCSNNSLFPHARIYVQRSELAFAIAPLEPSRAAYENTTAVSPPWLSSLHNIIPVEGPANVAPGVSVIPLPGHTPGSQGVVVKSGDITFLLAGDCIDTYANWKGDSRATHILNGSFTNLEEYMNSLAAIESMDVTIIPSHDFEVVLDGRFQG